MKPAAMYVPWTPLASGRALALRKPVPPGLLDIRRDIAVPLSLACRFAGQMPSGVLYSVAQHSIIGADWLFARTFDTRLALAFLLHDAHEAMLGDITSPVLAAMQDEIDAMRLQLGVGLVPRISVAQIKKRLAEPIDRAIYEEAGLPWPLPPQLRDQVALVDVQLLLAERDHLLAPSPLPWDADIRGMKSLALKQRIKPLPSARAADGFLQRYEQWTAQLRAEGSQPALAGGAS